MSCGAACGYATSMYGTSWARRTSPLYAVPIALTIGSTPGPYVVPGVPGGLACFMKIARAAVVVRKLTNAAAASGFLLFAVTPTDQPIQPVDAGNAPAFSGGMRKKPTLLPSACQFSCVAHGPSSL